MENCVFCSIVNGKIPVAKIWEDEKFLAFLDNRPNTPGMTLVIPKQHYDSYIFNLEDDFYQEYLLAVKKVVQLLERALKVKRVILVAEGLGVNHAHFKLYPAYGLRDDFVETEKPEEVFFKEYPGYLTTLSGPPADPEGLNQLAQEISKYN